MEVPVPVIKETPIAPCGFCEEFCDVSWFPEYKPPTATEPEQQEAGQSTQSMTQTSWIPGWQSCRIQGNVQKDSGPPIVREWSDFTKDVPDSDCVTDYVTKHTDKL